MLLAFLAVPAHAQKVSLGLKGGVDFAAITRGDLAADPGYRAGFAGGGFLVTQLARNVSFMPELLYTQKGFEYEEGTDAERLRVHYIELPMLFRFSPSPDGRRVVPFAMLGPAVGLNVGCRMEAEGLNLDIETDCEKAGGAKDVEFSGAAGIGTDFVLKRGVLSLDARYGYGFTKVLEEGDFHNSVFTIMLGYRMGVKQETVALTR
ncbi:MAG TPA: porin family protein [Longimicrobiales bacterium]